MASETRTFNRVLARSIQLDALAYVIIAALMVVAVVLAFMLFNSVAPPTGWVLSDPWVQLTGLTLIGVIVFYLLDQHARLRKHLATSHHDLALSKAATERAFRGLLTAHSAAEIMVAVADEESLLKVTDSIRDEMGADAVAIVGEELLMSAGPDADVDRITRALTAAAADAVSHAAPLAIRDADDGSETMALPLRLMGKLHGVLCVWHERPTLESDELDSLRLVARVIELGWESRLLYHDVSDRLEGTLGIITSLIDQQIPGYKSSTEHVRRLALKVGAQVGMTPAELENLRVAVEMRDFGVLRDTGGATLTLHGGERDRSHPAKGADLAAVGKFPASVQAAIKGHHEALDGSGYPSQLVGDQIPIAARIIRACDTFVSLAPGEPDRIRANQALRELHGSVRTVLDPTVVAALTRTVVDEVIARATMTEVRQSA